MNKRNIIKETLLLLILPKINFLVAFVRIFNKNNKNKMKLSNKVLIGSSVTLVIIVLFGWIAFPKFLKSQIKKVSVLHKTNCSNDCFKFEISFSKLHCCLNTK